MNRFRRLVVLMAVVAVLVAVGIFWRESQIRKETEQMVAEIAERGEPLDSESVRTQLYPPLPAEVDATDLWQQVDSHFANASQLAKTFEELPHVKRWWSTEDGSEFPPPPGQGWPKLETAEQLLAPYRPLQNSLYKAGAIGGRARFINAWPTKGLGNVLLPHFDRTLRIAPRLLELDLYIACHQGDGQRAFQAMRARLAVGRSVEEEPLCCSFLFAMRDDRTALAALEEVVGFARLSDGQLEELQRELRSLDYRKRLHRALQGDRVVVLDILANPDANGIQQNSVYTHMWHSSARPVRLHMLRIFDRVDAAVAKPWSAAIEQLWQIEAELPPDRSKTASPLMGRLTRLLPTSPGGEVMITAPTTGQHFFGLQMAMVAAHGTVRAKLADAAIACLRFRNAHGQLPASLADVVSDYLPELPVDPIQNLPIELSVGDGEITVKCVPLTENTVKNLLDEVGPLEFRVRVPGDRQEEPHH